jgi:hypothetical protein
MKTQMDFVQMLSDDELLQRVSHIAQRERGVSTTLIAHLAEVDNRRLYLPMACSSMFRYCTRELKFSGQEAYNRIKAARVAIRFPVVLDHLEDGRLNLTSLVLLMPILTGENHVKLFAAAEHKTRRQVERIVAELRPLPPVATMVRKLPARRAVRNSVASPVQSAGSSVNCIPLENLFQPTGNAPAREQGAIPEAVPRPIPTNTKVRHPSEPVPAGVLSAPRRYAVVAPLSPDLYKLQVTISSNAEMRLRQAQELLRHGVPDGNPALIIERALELLVEKLQKRKFGATSLSQRGVNCDLQVSVGEFKEGLFSSQA